MHRKKGYDRDKIYMIVSLFSRTAERSPSLAFRYGPLFSQPAPLQGGRFSQKGPGPHGPGPFYMYLVGYALCKVNSGRMLPTSSCLWLRILGVWVSANSARSSWEMIPS